MKTTSGNPALIELIRAEITRRGPVPFAWFMERALYHPEHGYYSSGRAVIGRHGDYFTNISVGPLFGKLMAAQFAEIWERLGRIDNFVVVEQGAHNGQFARDVLESARRDSPALFSALRYRIVEPFPVWRDRQTQTLEPFREKMEWCPALEPFTGVHFSNELLDAMPAGKRSVALNGDEFVFTEEPPENLTALSRQVPERDVASLNWIDDVAASLQRGFVIAVDYGFPRREFREVIQARAQHRLLDSPFEEIGEADITMHVNWTEIAERAETNGLKLAGFTDQHHFLTGLISRWPELITEETSKRALQTLLHPEMLGRAFQVLALSKDVDLTEPLAGFTYARNLL